MCVCVCVDVESEFVRCVFVERRERCIYSVFVLCSIYVSSSHTRFVRFIAIVFICIISFHFSRAACLITNDLPFYIYTDIAELDGGKVAKIIFPNPNDFSNFHVHITPDSGYWKNATYQFVFTIPSHYPHSPPKVECTTKIYHPNIDLQGKVCLNILREDWRPVLDINSVIYGLIYLFYEPNPDDPLNHEAAELFRRDITQFERLVNRTLKGGSLDGTTFQRLV